ncbi:MAG: hypothetical protein ACRDOL_40100 [Streptosporangiaceae bacterium]
MAYFIVGVTFFVSLTGTRAVVSVVPLFVLLGLVLAALIVVLVDTVRLRRLDAVVREYGPDGALAAALRGRPGRRRAGLVRRWVAAGCLALVAVVYLPRQVDAVAYLAGAGHLDTFLPVSYSQVCGKVGCSTVTDGILEDDGAAVTWPGQVPLDRSFSVRAPVWAAGPGSDLIPSAGTAVDRLILGLLFEVLAAIMVLAAVPGTRYRLARLAARLVSSKRGGHRRAQDAGRPSSPDWPPIGDGSRVRSRHETGPQ